MAMLGQRGLSFMPRHLPPELHRTKPTQHHLTKKSLSLKQMPVCPLLQRNGYAGEARAEFQEGTVRENEMDSEREGERQGERHTKESAVRHPDPQPFRRDRKGK